MPESLLPPGLDQIIYSLTNDGIPDIPMIGITKLTSARNPLVEHRHPGIMEFRYLRSGELTWNVDGTDYVQKANEFFVTFPGEWHSTGRHPQGRAHIYWLQVQIPDPDRPFLGLDPDRAAPLIQDLLSLPRRHFTARLMAQQLFQKIIQLHQESQARNTLLTLDIAARLQAWLLMIVDCANNPVQDNGMPGSDKIDELVAMLRSKPAESFRPAELAEMLGLSPSRFHQRFKDRMGMPPGEFILRNKIEEARRLLGETTASITDISFKLGFSSSQYFATVFKRYTHMTPRDARRKGGA